MAPKVRCTVFVNCKNIRHFGLLNILKKLEDDPQFRGIRERNVIQYLSAKRSNVKSYVPSRNESFPENMNDTVRSNSARTAILFCDRELLFQGVYLEDRITQQIGYPPAIVFRNAWSELV